MTFTLGVISRTNLQQVHPQLVALVNRAILISSVDFQVTAGARTLEQEEKMVADGASQTLHSHHLIQKDGYGGAVDLVPFYNGSPHWDWNLIYPIAATMQQVAKEAGVEITWGGVWDRLMSELPSGAAALKAAVTAYEQRHPGRDFIDGPHFELGRN